jgi:hypothetical protein
MAASWEPHGRLGAHAGYGPSRVAARPGSAPTPQRPNAPTPQRPNAPTPRSPLPRPFSKKRVPRQHGGKTPASLLSPGGRRRLNGRGMMHLMTFWRSVKGLKECLKGMKEVAFGIASGAGGSGCAGRGPGAGVVARLLQAQGRLMRRPHGHDGSRASLRLNAVPGPQPSAPRTRPPPHPLPPSHLPIWSHLALAARRPPPLPSRPAHAPQRLPPAPPRAPAVLGYQANQENLDFDQQMLGQMQEMNQQITQIASAVQVGREGSGRGGGRRGRHGRSPPPHPPHACALAHLAQAGRPAGARAHRGWRAASLRGGRRGWGRRCCQWPPADAGARLQRAALPSSIPHPPATIPRPLPPDPLPQANTDILATILQQLIDFTLTVKKAAVSRITTCIQRWTEMVQQVRRARPPPPPAAPRAPRAPAAPHAQPPTCAACVRRPRRSRVAGAHVAWRGIAVKGSGAAAARMAPQAGTRTGQRPPQAAGAWAPCPPLPSVAVRPRPRPLPRQRGLARLAAAPAGPHGSAHPSLHPPPNPPPHPPPPTPHPPPPTPHPHPHPQNMITGALPDANYGLARDILGYPSNGTYPSYCELHVSIGSLLEDLDTFAVNNGDNSILNTFFLPNVRGRRQGGG